MDFPFTAYYELARKIPNSKQLGFVIRMSECVCSTGLNFNLEDISGRLTRQLILEQVKMEKIQIKLCRRDLIMLTGGSEERLQEAIDLVRPYLKRSLNEQEIKRVRMVLTTVRAQMRQKYDQVHRNKSVMEQKFGTWLAQPLTFPADLLRGTPETQSLSTSKVGKAFSEKGKRSQQREVHKISAAQTEDIVPLLKGTSQTMKRRGQTDIAAVLSALAKSPSDASKIRKFIATPQVETQSYSPEEALALMVDVPLSTHQYRRLRSSVKLKGHKDLYPPYHVVLKAERSCRPPPHSSDVTHTQAPVPIQNL